MTRSATAPAPAADEEKIVTDTNPTSLDTPDVPDVPADSSENTAPEASEPQPELSPVQKRNLLRQQLADAQHTAATKHNALLSNRDEQAALRDQLSALRNAAEQLRTDEKAAREQVAELRTALKA